MSLAHPDCTLCSSIQAAMTAERTALALLHDQAEATGFRWLPPAEGEGVSMDAWMEFACRRDEYDRARSRRLRADNRFFEECPRCHFDLAAARRELETRRAELPWFGAEARAATVRFSHQVRATGS
ncbi:MAG: hypothetical protein ACAI25_07475 [Planctomycetota bacterium]